MSSLLDNMPHRCTIRVLKPTRDAIGGIKLVPTEVSTDNECWEQAATNDEILQFEKRGIIASRKVYFPTDPSVQENHEILITSRDRGVTTIASPQVLKVKSRSEPDATAGLGRGFKVMCDDQTGGNQ